MTVSIVISCDRCLSNLCVMHGAGTDDHGRQYAARHGWKVPLSDGRNSNTEDVCPQCLMVDVPEDKDKQTLARQLQEMKEALHEARRKLSNAKAAMS